MYLIVQLYSVFCCVLFWIISWIRICWSVCYWSINCISCPKDWKIVVCVSYQQHESFLNPKCIEIAFWAIRVLLDPCNNIVSSAIKFASVFLGKFFFSRLIRLKYYFHENFRCSLKLYENNNFLISLSVAFLNPNTLASLFLRKKPNLRIEMREINHMRIVGILWDKLRKS